MAKTKERSSTDTPDSTPILPGIVCTMQMYSDRHVYIVERISKSGKTAWVKRAERGSKGIGWYCKDTDELTKVQRNDEGHWRTVGGIPCFVYMGVADPYYDRSF